MTYLIDMAFRDRRRRVDAEIEAPPRPAHHRRAVRLPGPRPSIVCRSLLLPASPTPVGATADKQLRSLLKLFQAELIPRRFRSPLRSSCLRGLHTLFYGWECFLLTSGAIAEGGPHTGGHGPKTFAFLH